MRRSRVVSLAEGQPAFVQGSTPAAVYLVKEGKVQVEYRDAHGDMAVVAELGAGDHFGEGAILDGREQRTSTVRCITPSCKVGVIGKGAFEAFLRASPELATTFEAVAARRNAIRLRSVIRLAAERSECTTRSLAQGEVVFKQGEPAADFFLVGSGAVQISYRTADGRMLPARTHREGDVFGASGLLLAGDGTRRDTAVAIEPTTLKAIPHARFKALMGHDSLLAEGLRRATGTAHGAERRGEGARAGANR